VVNGTADLDASLWTTSGGVTLTRTTAESHSGLAAISAVMTATDNWIATAPFNLVANRSYTAIAWVKGTAGEIVSAQIDAVPASLGEVTMTGSWIKMAVGFVATVSGSANLSFNSKSGAQTFFVDDVVVIEGGVPNLVANGSYEAMTTLGLSPGWTYVNSLSGQTKQTTDQVREGRYALKLVASASALTSATTTGAIGGATAERVYTGDIWVWSPVLRSYTVTLTEAGGASASAGTAQTYNVQPSRWARLSVSRQVVANDRTRMEIKVDATMAANDYVYVDAASIVLGPDSVASPREYSSLDPTDAGWEEVYGPDFPLTENDVPALANGRSRLRWEPTTASFILEFLIASAAGSGRDHAYVEMGRVTLWHNESSPTQFRHVVTATVAEWTQERAVLKLVMLTASGGTTRAAVFITLQRGWSAPKFEVYPVSANFPNNGIKIGGEIRWSPAAATTTDSVYAGWNGTTHALQVLQSDGSWGTAAMTSFGANTHPYAALSGVARTMAMSVKRTTDQVKTYNDTAAYGSTRKAIAIATPVGVNGGYVGSRLHFAPAGAPSDNFPTSDGVRNFAAQSILDLRMIPELVAR
jgi:hypothetical protein